MKLKTLKELECQERTILDELQGTGLVYMEVLKEEAIKWVKEHTALSKDNVRFETKPFGFKEVMKMNNITEEDLK